MNESDLHGYQKTAIQHIIDNKHCALFLEMGLGKTVSGLTAVNYLMFQELEIDSVLVIAPKRVAENVWDTECNNWEHLKHLTVSKIIGTARQRRDALKKKADIYIIGRDNVAWLCAQYGGSSLPFDMLIIDELSSFKSSKSARFKALKLVQPSFKRVVGLTGTPAPNGLIDLWSQMYLIDRGERLGKYISHYREKYFKPDKQNGHITYSYKLIADGEKKIHEAIGDICMSMKSKDYLSLPERVTNVIKLKLDSDVMEMYKRFEKEKVLELMEHSEDDAVFAVNAAVLSNKLLQFANGALYNENKKVHNIHDAKINAVKEIVEDSNGQSILIAYTYRHDLDRLMEALKKYKPRQLKTEQDIEDWNAGKIRILIMHPASGGHGLNLQYGGNTIIWFGQTWSLELEQQFNARLHRQGQTKPVIIHKLVAGGTIDQRVIKAQENKKTKQDGLMDAVKALIDKYSKNYETV